MFDSAQNSCSKKSIFLKNTRQTGGNWLLKKPVFTRKNPFGGTLLDFAGNHLRHTWLINRKFGTIKVDTYRRSGGVYISGQNHHQTPSKYHWKYTYHSQSLRHYGQGFFILRNKKHCTRTAKISFAKLVLRNESNFNPTCT